MLKNKIAPKATAGLLAMLMATGTAVAMSAPVMADPVKGNNASGGVEGQNGIVWGDDAKSQGSYKVPTTDAGVPDGFCIDKGRPYPKQNGGTTYGPAVPWGGHLDEDMRKRLIVALMVGQGVSTGTIPPEVNQIMGFLGLPGNTSLDDIAAGVSGVVHMAGAQDGLGDPVSADDYSGNARLIFDRIMYDPVIGAIPTNILDSAVKVKVRMPEDPTYQRMLVVSDIDISFPEIIFPPITPPTTTPPDSETTTPSTTPPVTTPPVTTPPTTPPTKPTKPEAPEKETPEIRTSAGTRADNIVEPGATIVDTVTYSNLTPGTEYRLVGETVDLSTGKKDGNSGEITFTPEETNGRVDIPIKISNVSGSELVVFERLYEGKSEEPVAVHEDATDRSQTLGTPNEVPEIRTSVDSSTGNVIQSGTVVNDTVSYRGLVPGKSYRLEARLMCKEGEADTGAVGVHEFVPEQANGQVTVPNIVVTDPDCAEQVAFEKLYEVDSNILVAVHEDINDAAQTFGGEVPDSKKKKKGGPEKPEPKPNMVAEANANANAAPAPAPGGIGGPSPVGTGGAPAPRQVINSVPSGDSVNHGVDLFNR